jgi:hypothetical protein
VLASSSTTEEEDAIDDDDDADGHSEVPVDGREEYVSDGEGS